MAPEDSSERGAPPEHGGPSAVTGPPKVSDGEAEEVSAGASICDPMWSHVVRVTWWMAIISRGSVRKC